MLILHIFSVNTDSTVQSHTMPLTFKSMLIHNHTSQAYLYRLQILTGQKDFSTFTKTHQKGKVSFLGKKPEIFFKQTTCTHFIS